MATVRTDAKERIDEYIRELPEFSKSICAKLRQVIFKAQPHIAQDWKWGPNYQYPKGIMVCGYGGKTRRDTKKSCETHCQ